MAGEAQESQQSTTQDSQEGGQQAQNDDRSTLRDQFFDHNLGGGQQQQAENTNTDEGQGAQNQNSNSDSAAQEGGQAQNQNQEGGDGSGGEEGGQQEGGQQQQQSQEDTLPEGMFRMAQIGNGRFTSIEELNQHLESSASAESKLSQLEASTKLSPKAKLLWDAVSKHEESGWTELMKQAQVMSFDLANQSDKEIRYMAFRNDKKFANAQESTIRTLFDAKEAEYGEEGERTAAQLANMEIDTISAKDSIKALQETYNTAAAEGDDTQPLSFEEAQNQRTEFRNEMLNGFAAIDNQLSFDVSGKNAAGEDVTGKFQIQFTQDQLLELGNMIFDPVTGFNNLMKTSGIIDENKQVKDVSKFVQMMSSFTMLPELLNQAFTQGVNDGVANHLKQNSGTGSGEQQRNFSGTDRKPDDRKQKAQAFIESQFGQQQ